MVSQADETTIKLEMMIDKAELERQLGTVFQTPGAKGPMARDGKPMTRPGEPEKPTTVRPDGGMNRQLSNLTRLAGIYFGITAMAKNSQIMSTTLGALGNIMGAILDSFLAPFLPMIAKALFKIAEIIPIAAKAGEDTVAVIESVDEGISALKEEWNSRSNFGKADLVADLADQGIQDALKMSFGAGGFEIANLLSGGNLSKPGWLKTTGEKAFGDVSSMREREGLPKMGFVERLTGPSNDTTRETMDAAFGGEIMPGLRGGTGVLTALQQMQDSNLRAFIERSAKNSPKFEINIAGMPIEQVMDTLRKEIDTKLTEANHNSGLGKP